MEEETYNDRIIRLYEEVQKELDDVSDYQIKEYRELLQYWNEEEDFSKMDKLAIMYRRALLP